MRVVVMDFAKLLGFRLLTEANGAKVGQKPPIASAKIGGKPTVLGGKIGLKPEDRRQDSTKQPSSR